MVDHYAQEAEEQRRRRPVEPGIERAATENSPVNLTASTGLMAHTGPVAPPALPTRASALQQMQRAYGNRAVQRFLQRGTGSPSPQRSGAVRKQAPVSSPISVQRQAPAASKYTKPPADGQWNSDKPQTIGSIERIHVTGLKHGNQRDDSNDSAEAYDSARHVKDITSDSAVGTAIVLVPDGLKAKEVDVLLYLHGYGIGYRQRDKARQGADDMEEGTVRDVEVDHMEKQLEDVNKSGGRPTVALMPQGSYMAQQEQKEDKEKKIPYKPYLPPTFGPNFNSDDYVDEVFSKVGKLQGVAHPRVTLAGHSGGGNTIISMMGKAVNDRGELKSDDEMKKAGLPTGMAEVALFDAINTTGTDKKPGQVQIVEQWMMAQINKDLRELSGKTKDEQDAYLQNTMMRFRGYYSEGSGYQTRYQELQKYMRSHLAAAIKKAKADKAHPLTLTPDQEKALRDNYVDSIQAAPTKQKPGHEYVMGTGKVEEALEALPKVKPAAASAPAPTQAPPKAAVPVPAQFMPTGSGYHFPMVPNPLEFLTTADRP